MKPDISTLHKPDILILLRQAINSVRQVAGMIAVAITCLPSANFKTESSP